MKKYVFVKTVQVGNFVVGLEKKSDALVYTTVPTEQNDGGVFICYVDPLRDKMLYATCRQLFDMASDKDKVAETLLANYCVSLFAVRSCPIADGKYLNELTCAVKNMYVRVKGETDKAGEELGIKEETSEEALAKMKEEEEIASMN